MTMLLARSKELFEKLVRSLSPPLDASQLFDAAWYSRKYLEAQGEPFKHFMQVGWKNGCNPNPFFDVTWYKSKYKVVGNPLLDYIRRDAIGRRNPHPLFDSAWYLRTQPDVAAAGQGALRHFLHLGRFEVRSPHPIFDSRWYSQRYSAATATTDPFFHFLEQGATEQFSPHPLFDTQWYLAANPELLFSGVNPLIHFVEEGALRGCDPHPLFGAAWYLERYPDIAHAKVNPLIHYLQCGASEGRDPHPHFQTQWYLSAYADVARDGVNPLVHYVNCGMREGRKPNFVFDPDWYARRYAHITPSEAPDFLHFVKTGRFANLQPGPFFSPKAYRSRYLCDVREAADPTAALLDHARCFPNAQRRDFGRRLMEVLSLAPHQSPATIDPTPKAGRNDLGRWVMNALLLKSSQPSLVERPRIAVQAHVFYTDMAYILARALAAVPVAFDLFISICDATRRAQTTHAFKSLPNLNRFSVQVVENRGRDIAPFVVAFGKQLEAYDFILHLHTKRSPHNDALSGWLDYLLENLLGTRDNVSAILKAFDDQPNLGVLSPATYEPVFPFLHIGGNEPAIRRVLSRMGKRLEELDPLMFSAFPSGSMFWMRGAVMTQMTKLGLVLGDFQPEGGQDDGTLAHAIERLLPAFALAEGLDAIPFSRGDGTFDAWRGLWRAPSSIAADVLIIDHNIGGGANKFVEMEIKKFLKGGAEVIRIFIDPALRRPVIEKITGEGTRFLAGSPHETMAESIACCAPREIIVNSLYGLIGEIGAILAALVEAKRARGAIVRLMIHDFHLACPSQHLLNWKQQYCGLPQPDAPQCTACVEINENIDPKWRSFFYLPTWRNQSQALIDLSDEVRFFNDSGIAVLSKALDVAPATRTVVPHASLKPLRSVNVSNRDTMVVGVLGILNYAKGINIVNQLARYMTESNRPGQIVVVGGACGTMHSSVRIHGPYELGDLPNIIESHGVNIVFLSSVVPETYCYTLSEAIDMRLPVLGFDLGAQGERLKTYKRGSVAPIESSIEDVYVTLTDSWRTFIHEERTEADPDVGIHVDHQELHSQGARARAIPQGVPS